MLMADRERLQERRQRLSSETGVETVLNFGRWFRLAAGRADSLAAEAARRGRRWLQGVSHSRAALRVRDRQPTTARRELADGSRSVSERHLARRVFGRSGSAASQPQSSQVPLGRFLPAYPVGSSRTRLGQGSTSSRLSSNAHEITSSFQQASR